MDIDLLTFDAAISGAPNGKKHLLLGNGFSIGAHQLFSYGTLYQQAKMKALPNRVQKVFDRYGTANFEAVLKHLDEAEWIARHYGLIPAADTDSQMRQDYEMVKAALVESISNVHPAIPSDIGDPKLRSCLQFLDQFNDLYTLNYDLLLYWASLVDGQERFEDRFGREPDTPKHYCIFLPTGTSGKAVFYLHGALHLYTSGGTVRKRVWNTTGVPLIDQVQDALNQREYPLVVSEGTCDQKRQRIVDNAYLGDCWKKFDNIQGSLFVFGHSLGKQDQHLADAISFNTTLQSLYVGIFGEPAAPENKALIAHAQEIVRRRSAALTSTQTGRKFKRATLDLKFYRSETAHIWDREVLLPPIKEAVN